VELAVDVSAYSDWCAHGLHVTLLYEKFFDTLAENSQVTFTQTLAFVELI
jgi:hypothetical protein